MNVMTANGKRQQQKEQGQRIMAAFTIDEHNNISDASAAVIPEAEHFETFNSVEGLSAILAASPMARAVEIWNALAGVQPVRRFASRAVAGLRIWKAIQHLQPIPRTRARTVALNHSSRGTAARSTPQALRAQNKSIQVIALLKRPKGATLQQIMQATSWQSHSVRGFISGHVKKKLGLKVRSFKRDGERVYAIKG